MSRPFPWRRGRRALLAVSIAGLQACATVPSAGGCGDPDRDPFEPFNRGVFAFDQALDKAVIKPVAKAYRAVLPEFVRDRIRSLLDNLKEPLVFANDLLQGRGQAAGITLGRFLVNSTFGLGGLGDPATRYGLPRQSGDFGQTLYAWGFSDGPYLVLPLFGPSNVRDAFGMAADFYASPAGHVGNADISREAGLSTGIADGIDERSRNIENLEQLEAASLDPYAYLRSVVRQHRQSVLNEARAASSAVPGGSGDELVDPGEGAAAPAAAASAASSPRAAANPC